MGSYLFGFSEAFVTAQVLAWVLAFVMLRFILPTTVAGIVASIKIGTVFIYFVFYADATFHVGGDSSAYLQGGLDFLERGYPWQLYSNKTLTAHFLHVFQHEPGRFIPYLYFYLCLTVFGADYYAPILGNVLVTIVSGIYLTKALTKNSRNEAYRKWFLTFFLLHWFTLAWSTILILKEPLVVLFTCVFVYGVSCLERRQWFGVIWILFSMAALRYTRYYLPVILIIGCLPVYLMSWGKQSWLAALAGSALVIYWVTDELAYFLTLVDWKNAVWNAIHFLLQPVPWRITEPAGFLKLPSILHWLMFIPATIGAVLVWHKTRLGKILVLLCLVNVGFYALVPAIGSTRHRAVFDSLFLVMQFEFFWVYLISKWTSFEGRSRGDM